MGRLRELGEIVDRPAGDWRHRDARPQSARLVPLHAQIERFSGAPDRRPEALVAERRGLLRDRSVFLLRKRVAGVDTQTDLHRAER